MQYFIGITLPDDYRQKIVNFQSLTFNNQLPDIVEPHITVKAQGGLTEGWAWLDKVKKVCSAVPAFNLTLSGPKSFGGTVLFLSTESKEVVELHRQLVTAIAPPREIIEKYFELDRYTAHMTLAQTSWGLSEGDLKTMKSNAEKELAPYPTFTVDFIRIYKEIEPGRYQPFQDIPLEG